MNRKPLVLNEGRIQQLQSQDQLSVDERMDRIERLFRQLLLSCALQGIEPAYEELQAELAYAMTEH